MEQSTLILDPEQEREEIRSIEEILKALRLYRSCSYTHINRTNDYLSALPKNHLLLLHEYKEHLNNVRDCFDKNQQVINVMLQDQFLCAVLGERIMEKIQNGSEQDKRVRKQDTEKTQSTLKLIARDWSMSCAEERQQSYKPIIDAIEEHFSMSVSERQKIKILVPGAGLGRLTYELACRGYECEGNEFSYFMLIVSYFILNECTHPNSFTLFPWANQFVNNLHAKDQVAPISFPDVCPAQNRPIGNMMMAAGDFLQVYKIPNSYDCVATCFFIDCANNVLEFIETIFRILVPGGVWINLGPLLYHYSDMHGENSIEPTYDQLLSIIDKMGFEILSTKTGLCTKYAQNPQSMQKSEYESVFWKCQKPLNGHLEV